MFETNFSGNNTIWEVQKIWGGTAPKCHPVSTGLLTSPKMPHVTATVTKMRFFDSISQIC